MANIYQPAAAQPDKSKWAFICYACHLEVPAERYEAAVGSRRRHLEQSPQCDTTLQRMNHTIH